MTPADAFPGLDTAAPIAGTVVVGLVIEVAMTWRFGWRAPLAAYSCLAVTGAVVSATDLAVRRVPNVVVLPAFVVVVALLVIASVSAGQWWALARGGIAAVMLGGFYLALGLAVPAGMGLGDVKWAAILGAYLGWLAWSAVITGTLLAFLAAAVVLVVMRVARRPRASLPMVPFMTFGAVAAVLATR